MDYGGQGAKLIFFHIYKATRRAAITIGDGPTVAQKEQLPNYPTEHARLRWKFWFAQVMEKIRS